MKTESSPRRKSWLAEIKERARAIFRSGGSMAKAIATAKAENPDPAPAEASLHALDLGSPMSLYMTPPSAAASLAPAASPRSVSAMADKSPKASPPATMPPKSSAPAATTNKPRCTSTPLPVLLLENFLALPRSVGAEFFRRGGKVQESADAPAMSATDIARENIRSVGDPMRAAEIVVRGCGLETLAAITLLATENGKGSKPLATSEQLVQAVNNADNMPGPPPLHLLPCGGAPEGSLSLDDLLAWKAMGSAPAATETKKTFSIPHTIKAGTFAPLTQAQLRENREAAIGRLTELAESWASIATPPGRALYWSQHKEEVNALMRHDHIKGQRWLLEFSERHYRK